MTIPGRWNVELYRGDSFVKTFEFADNGGVALDLSAYTPAMHLRRYGAASSEDPVDFSSYFYTDDLASGVLVLDVDPAITEALTVGTYRYDIELATADNADVQTYLAGTLTVLEDKTL